MDTKFRSTLFAILFLGYSLFSISQTNSVELSAKLSLDPNKVAQFEKYVAWKHGFLLGSQFDSWKNSNTMLYIKEMWYYSESFYVKRDSFPSGITLNESGFDVTRFETKRNASNEVTLTFDGSKDVIVLLPENKLLYKP